MERGDAHRTGQGPAVGIAVLIVDDDEETRQVLSQVLGRDGIVCVTACDGEEALRVFATSDVGAALIDFELPDLTGVQLIREFKRSRPEVPVLLMTGNTSQRVLFEACDAGAYTYLRKPLDLQRVRDLVVRTRSEASGGLRLDTTEVHVKRRSVFIRWSRRIVRGK